MIEALIGLGLLAVVGMALHHKFVHGSEGVDH